MASVRCIGVTAGMLGPAKIIDVRTAEAVSEAQAQANAMDLFKRKTGKKALWAERTRLRETEPNYSIGPKER